VEFGLEYGLAFVEFELVGLGLVEVVECKLDELPFPPIKLDV